MRSSTADVFFSGLKKENRRNREGTERFLVSDREAAIGYEIVYIVVIFHPDVALIDPEKIQSGCCEVSSRLGFQVLCLRSFARFVLCALPVSAVFFIKTWYQCFSIARRRALLAIGFCLISFLLGLMGLRVKLTTEALPSQMHS